MTVLEKPQNMSMSLETQGKLFVQLPSCFMQHLSKINPKIISEKSPLCDTYLDQCRYLSN